MSAPLDRYWSLLHSYLRPQSPRVALLAVLLLGGIGLQLVNPLILRFFIDAALAGRDTRSLTIAALLFTLFALIGQGIGILETYVAGQVAWTATNALRADLTAHCLGLDLGFHADHAPGEMIERVDGDVTVLANFFSRFVIATFGNLLLLLGMLVVLFTIDWRVGTVFSAFALAVLLALERIQRIGAPRWQRVRQASAELFGFIEERLAGAEDLRANGALEYTLLGLSPYLRSLLMRFRAASAASGAAWVATVVLFALGTGAAFALGARLFDTGAITLGTVYLIVTYADQLRRPIEQMSRHFQDFQQAAGSIIRIRELLETKSAINDSKSIGVEIPSGPLSVEFEAVSFGYTPDNPVLRDLTFTIPAGTTLGILGRTGSGKTTLARLLFRLYDPTSGAIRLGGVELRRTRLADLRGRVGLVTQDVQLFAATVRDNLTFFDRSVADQRLLEIIAELGLEAWYQRLPSGLDSPLGPSGSTLSAGEAQLLALCRVFLKDPGLVILDEASARLDPATEQLIDLALRRVLTGRSAIIVAHRLTTITRCDQIMVIEAGRVAEFGPREALQANPSSRFAQVLRTGSTSILDPRAIEASP